MLKNKLTELLSSFTKEENNLFYEFATSSYFNKSGNMIKLLGELRKYYPGFDNVKLTNEYLYNKVFAKEEYNEQVMRNLYTQLFKLGREFLAIEQFRRNGEEFSLSVLNQYASKELHSFFNSELKELESNLKNDKDFQANSFLYLYKMEIERLNYLIQNDRQQEAIQHILTQNNYLIYYFIAQISNAQNNLKINEDTFNAKYEVNLVKELILSTDFQKVMKYILRKKLPYGSMIHVYYYKMMCSVYPDVEDHYYKLRSFLDESISTMSNLELYSIITTLEVYCTNKIGKGKMEYYKELVDLYKLGIKHKTFIKGNPPSMTALKFRNIYICAFRLGEYEWAKEFIDSHKKFLTTDGKAIAELAYAQLDFQEGNYESSIEKLNSIDTDFYYVKKDIRRVMLQILYEQDDIEGVLSQLNSFRQYINNNSKLINDTKDNYIRFINVMTNLAKLKSSPKKEKLKLLEEKVKSDRLPAQGWIEEKIKELIT